jgi:hypothetical protein
MSLVTGFKVSDGNLKATCIQLDGSEVALAPHDLRTEALPMADPSRLTATLVLGEFEPTCFSEYASNFGYRSDGDLSHQTWVAAVGKYRVVIPALVLLRGIFRSFPTLWPALFAPSTNKPGLAKALEAMLVEPNELKAALPLLSWMHCYPSAKAMWASVQASAADGKIDLQLPAADLHVMAYGQPFGRNFYVTRISISSIQATEAPYAFAPHSNSTIWVKTPMKRPSSQLGEDLPLRATTDGSFDITDEEWSVVSSILEGPNYKKLSRELSRRFLNAHIRRTVQGMTLGAVAAAEGVHPTSLHQALTRWRKDGRWEQIVRYLDSVRPSGN